MSKPTDEEDEEEKVIKKQQKKTSLSKKPSSKNKKEDNMGDGSGNAGSVAEETKDGPKESRSATCSYLDFSRVPVSGSNTLVNVFKAASAKEPTFPVKLHLILSNPEFEDIISWMPHGRSWRILRPDVFEDRILPLFFCHSRLSSFMRQVNGWGFRRIKHGPDYNSYYHERFLRGLTHLVETMRRESVTAKSKAEGEDEPAPDLYKISGDNPLPENPTLPEYRRRNAGADNPTAGVVPGTSDALVTCQMQPVRQDSASKSSIVGVGGLDAVSSARTMPNSMPGANGMPSNITSLDGAAANQAEFLNAFRSARIMEQQQHIATMSNPGVFGGGVGRWGGFTDQMYQNAASGATTMAQMDFQNRMAFGGVAGMMPGMQGIMGLPGMTGPGIVSGEMNQLAYHQQQVAAAGLGQASGWGNNIPSNFYQPDAGVFSNSFAQHGLQNSQLDFNAIQQHLQMLRNSNFAAQMGAGTMNPPGGSTGL